MVIQSKEFAKMSISKEAQAKHLIMTAWRERWDDVKFGINVGSVRIRNYYLFNCLC